MAPRAPRCCGQRIFLQGMANARPDRNQQDSEDPESKIRGVRASALDGTNMNQSQPQVGNPNTTELQDSEKKVKRKQNKRAKSSQLGALLNSEPQSAKVAATEEK